MDLWYTLPPDLQAFLTSVGSELTAEWTSALLRAVGRRVRDKLEGGERQQALQRAAGAAIWAVVKDWQIALDEYADMWERCRAWLLEPAVLSEFRLLLAPGGENRLDFELLREEFLATGLDIQLLGKPDFDALVQDMIAAFYLAASDEPILQAPIKIKLLRQMAEELGALTRIESLTAQQTVLGRRSLGQLERLNLVADRVAEGQDEAIVLLRALVQSIIELPSDLAEQQRLYQQTADVLTRVELGNLIDAQIGDNAQNVAVGSHISMSVTAGDSHAPELLAVVRQMNEQLQRIAHNLTTAAPQLDPPQLVALERNYRQSLIDRFEKLTFRGISPTGKPLALDLEQIYVELKAVGEVPEAADTYSTEERRLLLEAEQEGGGDVYDLRNRLDALRLERWRGEARCQHAANARLQRRSISEILADPSQRDLVILGDPGAGKSTLLHYLAVSTVRRVPARFVRKCTLSA